MPWKWYEFMLPAFPVTIKFCQRMDKYHFPGTFICACVVCGCFHCYKAEHNTCNRSLRALQCRYLLFADKVWWPLSDRNGGHYFSTGESTSTRTALVKSRGLWSIQCNTEWLSKSKKVIVEREPMELHFVSHDFGPRPDLEHLIKPVRIYGLVFLKTVHQPVDCFTPLGNSLCPSLLQSQSPFSPFPCHLSRLRNFNLAFF